jgi:cytochrome c556
MGRMKEVQNQPVAFQAMMTGSENATQKLEDELRVWAKQTDTQTPPETLQKAWNTVQQSCTGCHQVYRVKAVEGLSD